MESVSFSAKAEKQKVTREQALRVARQLGCQGAHQHDDGGWMPCNSHDEFVAIRKSKNEYYKISAQHRFEVGSEIGHRVGRLESKSSAYYENRADAENISKINGCGSVRTVVLDGKRYYTPCDHKPRRAWEKLNEKPITGIETLAGGGLVTGSFSGKNIDDDVEKKGFVNFVSRSTDPDTFSNPDSARVRARNLGCIGIRRYTASDGKLVWLPCSNVSDYNRVTGIRGDNSPRNNPRRQGSGFKKKILGTPIGVKPNGEHVDGDGDGFTTGGIVGGEDIIPVVATRILEHAGSLYLKNFEKQKSDLEKKFGDLRNVENARKAFEKTFPRLKSFDLFDDEDKTFSSELNFARAVTLLHLGQDKRISETISEIGFIDENNPDIKDASAVCAVGLFDDDSNQFFVSHAILFNKSIKSAPQSSGGRLFEGWGDAVVERMREQKVPQSEIDKFWGMYVSNHEWTHAEHNVAMFEQHKLKLDGGVYDIARFAFEEDKQSFDKRVKTAVELTKKGNNTRWGLFVSDEQRRQQVLEFMVVQNQQKLRKLLAKGYYDDLHQNEKTQLEGNYPRTVSNYAAENFNELVAEKGSAYRMGHPVGDPNNPAWRKLIKFVRGGRGVEEDIVIPEGLSRNQRRQLEREREKLKKSLENLPFGIDWAKVSPIDRKSIPGESLSKSGKFISIFGRCEGFTYYFKNNRKQKGSESGKKGISEGIFSLKTALRPKRKNPTIDSDVVNMLAIRVRQHNATVSNTSHKTNLRDVKVVYLRGLSVGDKKTALKRVNNFFQAMASNTPLPKGQRQDFDIVPETHPSKDKKTAHKDGGFDDGEFGIKYKSACCPQLVKRHKRL